ncbi:MAG: hypothetical protein ACI9X4_000612 [Glaciecola sp.]
MRLEDYVIEARKRTDWEVMDLGTLLLQKNLGSILRSGMLIAIPILAVMVALVITVGFFWGYLFLWLMRPLYGRVTLFVLSRAVFASHPSPRDIARALPGFLSHGLWAAVLISPWTLSRVIAEPVLLLEGLRGKELRKRSQVLLGEGVRGAVWWGAVSVGLVQASILVGTLVLLYGFVPEGVVEWSPGMLSDNPSALLAWAALLCLALSFALVEPLWVAIGFAMYLNRRSDLEGWDVELVFRRLAQRASQGIRLSGLSILGVLACWPSRLLGQGEVAETGLVPQRPVDVVFASEEFKTTMEVPFNNMDFNPPHWLGGAFELFAWIAVGAVTVWLVYSLIRWSMGLEAPAPRIKEAKSVGALELAGLDLRRESLPKDVVAEARALWGAGQTKEALSLLYRGSLVVLRDEHGLFIEDGDTEGRCLNKVVKLGVLELGTYFGGLTDLWTRLAYGGESLDEAAFSGLATGYGQHFGGRH